MEQARKEGEEKENDRKEADREEEIKLELLDASLKQVMRHGWSKEAVRAAAEELGRPSVVAGLVKGGGAELVFHHVAVCNKQLNAWMEEEVARQKKDGGRVKVGKFVREAVVRRLSMNGEYVRADRWSEALALTAIPPHCEGALKGMQTLCDDIWYHAGDISTDYNWIGPQTLRTLGLFSTEGSATYRQHLALLRFLEMLQPYLGDWQPLPEIWPACRNRTFLYLKHLS